jgi:large subunit ribosomal protein L25
MSSETIKASVRSRLGSRAARELRAQGKLPATIQGGQGSHLDISVDEREFMNARRHHVHLFDLEVDGRVESATIRELKWRTFGDGIEHIEFRRVRRDVKTEVTVPLDFVGHPKEGVLNHLRSELQIRCLPALIPDSIEVKVDRMEMGKALLARDIALPEGFELVTPAEMSIAVVVAAHGLDVPAPAEAAPAEPSAATPAASPEKES